jgi:hypothetical protein
MNWTGGKLQRHSKKGNNATLEKQRQHFAKARTDLQNGPSTSRPRIFGDEDGDIQNPEPVRRRKPAHSQSRLEAFHDFVPVVDRLSSMTPKLNHGHSSSVHQPQRLVEINHSAARAESASSIRSATKRKDASIEQHNTNKEAKTAPAKGIPTDSMLERQRKLLLSKSNWVGVQGISAPHFDFVSDRGKDNFGKRRKVSTPMHFDHERQRVYVSSVREYPARRDGSLYRGNAPSESIHILMGGDAATSRMAASQRSQDNDERADLSFQAGSDRSILRDDETTDPAQHSEFSNLKQARPAKMRRQIDKQSSQFPSHTRDDFMEATDEDYEKAERLLSTTERDQQDDFDPARVTVDETIVDDHVTSSEFLQLEETASDDEDVLEEARYHLMHNGGKQTHEEADESDEDADASGHGTVSVKDVAESTGQLLDQVGATFRDNALASQKTIGTRSTVAAAVKRPHLSVFQQDTDDNDSSGTLPAISRRTTRSKTQQEPLETTSPHTFPAIFKTTSPIITGYHDDNESVGTLPAILKTKDICQPLSSAGDPIAQNARAVAKPTHAPTPSALAKLDAANNAHKPESPQQATKAVSKPRKYSIDPDAAWKAFVFGKLPINEEESAPLPEALRKLGSSSMNAQPGTPHRQVRSSSLLTSERDADAKTTAATVAPSSSITFQSDHRSSADMMKTQGSDFDRPSSIAEASVMPDVLKTDKLVICQSSSPDPLIAGHAYEPAKLVQLAKSRYRSEGARNSKIIFNRSKPFGGLRHMSPLVDTEEDLVRIGHRGGMRARDVLKGAASEDEAAESIEDE